MRFALAFALVLTIATTSAQTPAHPDPAVNEALQKLGAIQKKYEAMRPGDAPTAQALMKELNPIGQRLGKVADKTHPAWTKAATWYNQLNTGIPEKYSNSSAPPDPAIAQIAAELDAFDKKLQAMKPGDTPTGIRYLNELKDVATRINAVTTKSHPSYSAIAKAYNRINQAIADKANETPAGGPGAPAALPPGANPNAEPLLSYQLSTYKRLARQVEGSIENFLGVTDAEALDPNYKSRYLSSMQNYQAQLKKINRPDHPDVARLTVRVNSISNLLDQRISTARGAQQSLGNYQEKLAEIDDRSRANRVPGSISAPFEPSIVTEFIDRARRIKTDSEQDLSYLQTLVGSSFAPDNLQSRIYWQQDRIRTVTENLNHSVANLRATLPHDQSLMEFFRDPKNDKRLVQEGGFAERGKRIGEIVTNIDGAALLFAAIGDAEGQALARTMKSEATALQSELDTRFASMLDSVRMPKKASTDSKLLKVARETLTSGDYEDVYPIEALVINSDIRHLEKKEGDIRSQSSYLTLTTYKYEWDQFQATTAEKVGDKYYLFYNTFKYYTSGDTTTYLNEWFLSGRIKGTQILKKNIDD